MTNKILIIDDDVDYLNDLTVIMSKFYKIYQAENSRSGYYYFKHHNPDLCLIDIQLNPYINSDAVLEGLYDLAPQHRQLKYFGSKGMYAKLV